METNYPSTEDLQRRIAIMRDRSPTDEEIEATMDELEKIVKDSPDVACSLMIDLWPIAGNACLHDVCDAISLWIVDHRSPAVVKKLTLLSESDPDLELRRYWLGMLSNP